MERGLREAGYLAPDPLDKLREEQKRASDALEILVEAGVEGAGLATIPAMAD